MRVACIAGFFEPVHSSIQTQLANELSNGSVVWIPQIGNGQLNQNKLKQAIFDSVAKDATEVLILLFLFRGTEYIRQVVDSMIEEAVRRSPSIKITVQQLKNARDDAGVLKLVKAFGPVPVSKKYPATLDGLSDWIDENHPSKVMLLPRAKAGAAKSIYEDTMLVYKAVELLAITYVAMRTSKPDNAEERRRACEHDLQELGLELAPSISPSRAGEEGAEYEVHYPPGQLIKKRTLDLHLKKGVDRDERNCLRIYFFWDDKANKVVIGWLTSHLDTRAS